MAIINMEPNSESKIIWSLLLYPWLKDKPMKVFPILKDEFDFRYCVFEKDQSHLFMNKI